MDYEKKYKEALELARVAAFNGHQSLMEGIFPELAESKDEKTRKRIIALVNAHGQGMYKDDMLAWLENIPYTIDHEKREGFHLGYKAGLEKQGEQSSLNINRECLKGIKRVQEYQDISDWEKEFDKIASMYAHNKNQEGYNDSWYVKERAAEMLYYAKKELEKQGGQKPTDEVGPITQSYIIPNGKFFQWIYDRLVHVHKENPYVDYMLSLKKRIEDMQNPANDDMKKALQTEYEKGRADAIAEIQKLAWSEKDE